MYLKLFEVFVLQFKPNCFRLTKKNCTLAFSLTISLAFTDSPHFVLILRLNTKFCMFSLFPESKENGQMVPKVVAINHRQTI